MRRVLLALTLSVMTVVASATAAAAACAPDPEELTYRQMIEHGETGDPDYDVMILGTAINIRDVGGGPGGRTIAKLAVAATPVGEAPLITRVWFYRPRPGVSVSDNFEFHRGQRYVVIAARRDGGGFRFDGACGQTRSVSRQRLNRLLDLAAQF